MKTYPKNTYKVLGWKTKDNCFTLVDYEDDHDAACLLAISYTKNYQQDSRVISGGLIIQEYKYKNVKNYNWSDLLRGSDECN